MKIKGLDTGYMYTRDNKNTQNVENNEDKPNKLLNDTVIIMDIVSIDDSDETID